MGERARDAFELLKATFKDWQEDKAERLAAALAYYTAFSIGPLLLIAIAIAGLVYGEEAARGQVVGQLQGLLGRQGAETIQTAIQNANKPASGIVATVIGLVGLVLGATGVFGQLKDALNTIWEVQPKPGLGVMAMIKDRLLSFGMVAVIGFLLLVSLVLSTVLAALATWFSGLLPGADVLWQIVNFVISFGVITLLFATMFKVLPDAEIDWEDVWIGAIITALLFTIGKTLLGIYIGAASVGSAFGAAGSLLVVLVWVYYSAQIFFFGAEFTQVYASHAGKRIQPSANAVPLTEEKREQQGMPHQDSEAEQRRAAAAGQPLAAQSSQVDREPAEPAEPAPAPPAVVGAIERASIGGLILASLLAALARAFRRDAGQKA